MFVVGLFRIQFGYNSVLPNSVMQVTTVRDHNLRDQLQTLFHAPLLKIINRAVAKETSNTIARHSLLLLDSLCALLSYQQCTGPNAAGFLYVSHLLRHPGDMQYGCNMTFLPPDLPFRSSPIIFPHTLPIIVTA